MVTPLLKSSALRRFWPLLAILLYWAVRLHNLDALPIFLDEAAHLDWARLVWRLQPFHAASDGKLLSIWINALFWPFASAYWVGRASTVLVATIGYAALLAFGRRFFSDTAAAVAGALYVVAPYAMFFERMALADGVSAAFVMVLAWSSLLLVQRFADRRWIYLGGVALFAALANKTPNITFVPVPLLAALLFYDRNLWRRQWRAVARAYVVALTHILPLYFVLRYLVDSDLGMDLASAQSVSLYSVVHSVGLVTKVVVGFYWTLLTPSLFLVVAFGALLTLAWYRRTGLYLLLIIIPSLTAVYFRTSVGFMEARFGLVYVPLLVLLAAGGIGKGLMLLARRGKFPLAIGASTMIVLLLPATNSVRQISTQPEILPLPQRDSWEYVTGWPSGYGFREIAREHASRDEVVQLVTFDLGGRQRLDGYLYPDSPVTPVWMSSEDFAMGLRPDPALGGALLVVDHPKDAAALRSLGLDLEEMGRYTRPGGESWLGVYELR